jgi:hypothetical protein
MLIHYHCRAFQKCHWARENVAWIAERRMLWLEQEIRPVGEQIILYTRMPRTRVLDHLLYIVEPFFLPHEQTDEYLVCIQSKREGEEINTLL